MDKKYNVNTLVEITLKELTDIKSLVKSTANNVQKGEINTKPIEKIISDFLIKTENQIQKEQENNTKAFAIIKNILIASILINVITLLIIIFK